MGEAVLRLGTRGSLLARTQSQLVASDLEKRHAGLKVELIILKTSGDRITDRPLHEFGGKGLFTKELEQALLDRHIDFAVHSYKDVPTTMPLVDPSGLIVASVPRREDPRDVLASHVARSIEELPLYARIGTGSLRRRSQLLALRPDLQIQPIRGNIDTRLRKLREGQLEAVVLAMAGVCRAGLFDTSSMSPLDPAAMLPAPAQGALALQCRREDERTRALLQAASDLDSAACVAAERALVAHLRGDCLSPIAALAICGPGQIRLQSAVGGRGGKPPVIRAQAAAPTPELAAEDVFHQLERAGALDLLHGAPQG